MIMLGRGALTADTYASTVVWECLYVLAVRCACDCTVQLYLAANVAEAPFVGTQLARPSAGASGQLPACCRASCA